MTSERVYIGCGAGFAGDRPDGGLAVVQELARRSGARFMIYETLAERTLALAQLRRMNGGPGYLPRLRDYLRPVLATCLAEEIRIIANFGAADPKGACAEVLSLAAELGLPAPRLAYVSGDDVTEGAAREALDAKRKIAGPLVAANCYIGAGGIAEALADGAEIVITGRVSDPALSLGPLVHAFGWAWDDWDLIASGTLCGHLLECSTQVTGGYFADPGKKDVEGLETIGFPIAEVSSDGSFVITKPLNTGGRVDLLTVREQLLYEIDDPANYLTPDVALDMTEVRLAEVGPDRVLVAGAKGKPRPETLRAMVCYRGGWFGEAEISYAGPNAVERGRLAARIVEARLAPMGLEDFRTDLIGISAIFGAEPKPEPATIPEVRLRLAASGATAEVVQAALDEVESLYLCGPAGGGGVRRSLTERLSSEPVLIPRALVRAKAHRFEESAHG